ncbi:hypothetical protein ABK040_008171 [Willaertia magna]
MKNTVSSTMTEHSNNEDDANTTYDEYTYSGADYDIDDTSSSSWRKKISKQFNRNSSKGEELSIDGVNFMKETVDDEWRRFGFVTQTRRDAEMWHQTLLSPERKERGDILRRLFTVLRWGGLYYRHKSLVDGKKKKNILEEEEILKNDPDYQWKGWYSTEWPICTALSHGGRIVIQLPKAQKTINEKEKEYDFSFWKWLLTGERDGNISNIVSTSSSSSERKVIFKRLGATHGLGFEGIESDENQQTNNITNISYKPLLDFGKKVLVEQKTSGFNLRDTKMLRSIDFTLKHHRHWGMNIPIGGEGKIIMTGAKSSANGSFGHLYLYHMAPSNNSYGGLLIGLEGSEYGRYDSTGQYHGVSAKSSPYSPTFGYKWHSNHHTDLSSLKGPGKYDCMYIDLTDGWEHLIEKSAEWKDDYVRQTSLPHRNDSNYKTAWEKLYGISFPRFLNIKNSKTNERFNNYVTMRKSSQLTKTNSSQLEFLDLVVRRKKGVSIFNSIEQQTSASIPLKQQQ